MLVGCFGSWEPDTGKPVALSLKDFLEECEIIPHNMSSYSIFTFEPVHNFDLGISKLVENWKFGYLSSDRPRTIPEKLESQSRPLCLM